MVLTERCPSPCWLLLFSNCKDESVESFESQPINRTIRYDRLQGFCLQPYDLMSRLPLLITHADLIARVHRSRFRNLGRSKMCPPSSGIDIIAQPYSGSLTGFQQRLRRYEPTLTFFLLDSIDKSCTCSRHLHLTCIYTAWNAWPFHVLRPLGPRICILTVTYHVLPSHTLSGSNCLLRFLGLLFILHWVSLM